MVCIANALATTAKTMSRALIGTNLDRAIGSSPTAVANARSIIAVTLPIAIVQTNAILATNAHVPLITCAIAVNIVALSVARAIKWASAL